MGHDFRQGFGQAFQQVPGRLENIAGLGLDAAQILAALSRLDRDPTALLQLQAAQAQALQDPTLQARAQASPFFAGTLGLPVHGVPAAPTPAETAELGLLPVAARIGRAGELATAPGRARSLAPNLPPISPSTQLAMELARRPGAVLELPYPGGGTIKSAAAPGRGALAPGERDEVDPVTGIVWAVDAATGRRLRVLSPGHTPPGLTARANAEAQADIDAQRYGFKDRRDPGYIALGKRILQQAVPAEEPSGLPPDTTKLGQLPGVVPTTPTGTTVPTAPTTTTTTLPPRPARVPLPAPRRGPAAATTTTTTTLPQRATTADPILAQFAGSDPAAQEFLQTHPQGSYAEFVKWLETQGAQRGYPSPAFTDVGPTPTAVPAARAPAGSPSGAFLPPPTASGPAPGTSISISGPRTTIRRTTPPTRALPAAVQRPLQTLRSSAAAARLALAALERGPQHPLSVYGLPLFTPPHLAGPGSGRALGALSTFSGQPLAQDYTNLNAYIAHARFGISSLTRLGGLTAEFIKFNEPLLPNIDQPTEILALHLRRLASFYDSMAAQAEVFSNMTPAQRLAAGQALFGTMMNGLLEPPSTAGPTSIDLRKAR